MPPKAKYTKDEIISAALSIVRTDGIDALTARSLGAKLGTSSQPIFTAFKNMDQVQDEVMRFAKDLYAGYVEKGLSEPLGFRGVGKQYILFAIREPKLFQLLFMREQSKIPGISGVLPLIDESYEKILVSVQDGYGFDRPDAENMYRHLWVYTHGIAALCATGMCTFTPEEISGMMTEVFTALLHSKSEVSKNGKRI